MGGQSNLFPVAWALSWCVLWDAQVHAHMMQWSSKKEPPLSSGSLHCSVWADLTWWVLSEHRLEGKQNWTYLALLIEHIVLPLEFPGRPPLASSGSCHMCIPSVWLCVLGLACFSQNVSAWLGRNAWLFADSPICIEPASLVNSRYLVSR